jgi:hypothetical protein
MQIAQRANAFPAIHNTLRKPHSRLAPTLKAFCNSLPSIPWRHVIEFFTMLGA